MKKILKKIKSLIAAISTSLKKLIPDTRKFLFIDIPIFFFYFIGYTLLANQFGSMSKDTTNLTNFGFAIFIGLSTVSFNWARTLERTAPVYYRNVNRAALNLLFVSLLFILASCLKYGQFNLGKNYTVPNMLLKPITYSCSVSSFLVFSAALYMALGSITKLIYIIYDFRTSEHY